VSIWALLLVIAIYTGGLWFFIPLVALLLAYSIIFVPIIISKYNLPTWIKNHNALWSIALYTLLMILLFIVINIYTASTTTDTFGWVFTIALPILAFLLLPIYATIIISEYIKINWVFKTSTITLVWLVAYTINYFLLYALGVDTTNQGMFWQANFSTWTPAGTMVAANVNLILNIVGLTAVVAFAIVGIILASKKKSKCTN